MASQAHTEPGITWDGTSWRIRLPVQDGNVLEAKWNPVQTYVARIREVGTRSWSFGFESPLTHFSFVDLKPDTEYEMQVRTRSPAGEGEPSLVRMRTGPAGNSDNVIPFPKR